MTIAVGLSVLGCGTSDRISGAGTSVCADDSGSPADSTLAASASLVSGTFSAPDVSATICRGGVFAVLEQGTMKIADSVYGPPASEFHFQKPVDAVEADLSVYVRVSDPATPGRYQSADGCGSIVFSAFLPVPASVDCQATPPAGMECPTGCALEGPVSGPSCMPVMPEIGYQAAGMPNCGYLQAGEGSFTLTLTSVAPDAQYADSYLVHGSLAAEMVGGSEGLGTSMGTLQLEF